MITLLLPTLLFLQTKTRLSDEPKAAKPAEYTVSIHVQSSRLEECPSFNSGTYCSAQRLSTVIGGKKYDLERYPVFTVLRPGDYKARVIKEKHPRDEEYSLQYEILLSDGKVARFDVIGESE